MRDVMQDAVRAPLERHRALKRGFDLVVAGVALVLTLPLWVAIALGVAIGMGRPVLFRQTRLGYRGELFELFKFRTMSDARDDAGEFLPDEERITRLGHLLRRTTLDELPELLNVLRGEMSVVGPRPLLPEYRDLYSALQWRRHETPPGMAGPAVAAGRNSITWEQKLAADVWYVDNWSLGLDLKILAASARKVLSQEGISADGHATMPRFEGTQEGTDA